MDATDDRSRVRRLRAYNLLAKQAYDKIGGIRRHLRKIETEIRTLEDELYALLEETTSSAFDRVPQAMSCIKSVTTRLSELSVQNLSFA